MSVQFTGATRIIAHNEWATWGIMAQTDRRFRHLYDLRGRTFVCAEYPDDGESPDACYACGRILTGYNESAQRRAFVTSAAPCKPGGPKEILWVCRSCFEEFRPELAFRLDSTMRLDDVIGEFPL